MHVPAPVTLVTGSAQGLGFAIAEGFAQRGDKVHTVWRGEPRRGETLRELYAQRSHHRDLSEEGASAALVERLLEIDGKLDHVVHCIGAFRSASLEETTPADWSALLESNLLGAVRLVDALREPLREGGGTLVLLACAGAGTLRGRRTCAAYAAAKSALLAFARSLALEEAPHGVRVNTISPGLVPHPAASATTRDPRRHERVPLGRAGTLEEIASAALWLSSPASSYAVGLDLCLSGGWMM